MMWLLLVLLSSFLDSTRIFVDNFISDTFFKGRLAASQKCFTVFAELITAIILIAVTGFNFGGTESYIFFLIILAGAIYTIGGIPYFRALEIEETTNIGIFVQLAPILYLVLGWIFLNESFSVYHLIAIPIILLAPLVVVVNARKRSRKVKLRAVFYAFLYVLFAVIGNLIFVKTNDLDSNHLNFFSETGFFYLGSCISNVIIVILRPKWRKRFVDVAKKNKLKLFAPISINFIINVIKNITYRAGLVLAPTVAIASAASDSVEPIIIFFMGIVLTLIWPQFGREKLQKKTILVHLVATVLVVVGIVLLQLPNM
ncbi:EamA family transporter [Candidatus Saccharibacteria bacterium]|nr:EamA family transporter [Candidatus Saccharibacteria bacterium]